MDMKLCCSFVVRHGILGEKVKNIKAWLWTSHTRAFICTVAIALSLNNIMRLPRETIRHGGVPFLLAHLILTLSAGLPLVLLQVGLGQFCQQGATKVWRAVPVFLGIGYIKLIASFLCTVYLVIYLGISVAYIIWIAKGPMPMVECREVYMTPEGYENRAIGLECLRKTFFKSLKDDPTWYGIIAVIMFALWLLLALCLYKLSKSLRPCFYILTLCVVGLMIAIFWLSGTHNLSALITDIDWSLLLESRIWYAAFVQVLFSTYIGFGYLITAAGTTYFKCNIIWTTFTYIIINLLAGWMSTVLWYRVSSEMVYDDSVVAIFLLIYDSAVLKDNSVLWPCLSFTLLLSSGAISVIALLYPIFTSYSIRFGYKWRIAGVVTIAVGIICSLAIFTQELQLITILEDYAIPLLAIFAIFMELIGFILVYGWKNVYNDLEFLHGNALSRYWLIIWIAFPILLCLLVSWRLYDYHVEEWPWNFADWQFWLLIVILSAALAIFILAALVVISRQVEYNICQKLKSAFQASRKWGPVDPMCRHEWLQWRAAASRDYRMGRSASVNYTARVRIRSLASNTNESVDVHAKDDTTHHDSTNVTSIRDPTTISTVSNNNSVVRDYPNFMYNNSYLSDGETNFPYLGVYDNSTLVTSKLEPRSAYEQTTEL